MKVFSNSSLRRKLVALLAAISAVTAGSVGAVSYRSMQTRLQTEIDRSLVQATDRFLDGPNGGRVTRPGGRFSIVIPDRPLGIEQYVVQVTSQDGAVIGATAGVNLPVVSADARRRLDSDVALYRTVTSAEGDRYRIRAVGIDLPGLPGLVLQLGRDYSETDNVLADLRLRVLIIGSAVVVIAALVGAAISTGVTSRIRRLSRAAELIAETGDLNVDLAVEGNDETGRLARSFQDMVAALERSRSQQQRLVQDAGHELRTPLTSLRTNIDVLRRHSDIDADIREQILSDLEQDISELGDLVEEIVSVAADVDRIAADHEPSTQVELGDLVNGVVERFKRRVDRDFRVVADRARVEIHPTAIERAVSNLLDNAIKFDSSGGTIDVDVSAGSVTVRDRGPGIAESDLDLVFERFHRSAEARSLPGSGLGLSIVADAALAHGGGYFARRRTGGGSEVGFWLPLAGQ